MASPGVDPSSVEATTGVPVPPPTPTGHILLGLLSFGQQLSGYELKQWAENLRFFWSAPAMSQVYRELERLSSAGLVAPREVVREGTRPTKVYSLTPAGRHALHTWLATPPAPPILRHPTALRVFFGHVLSSGELRAALETHRAWCDTMLDQLSAVRDDLGDDPTWRGAAQVADWGLGYYRGEIAAIAGIREAGTDQAGADQAGIQEAGTDEAGADQAGTGRAGDDDRAG